MFRRAMVQIHSLPSIYGERYRRKLNAGAECVSLKNRSPYFYEVGSKCNECLQDVELSAFLQRTFKTRYYELISKGLSTMTGEEMLELCSKLSVEELQLFEGGKESIAETERWLGDVPRGAVFKLGRKRAAADALGGQGHRAQAGGR